MNMREALDEICCFKIVKAIPYLYVTAVTYEQASSVVADVYLKNLDGTPLTFKTRNEAQDWLYENIDKAYIAPDPFAPALEDKDYYKYSKRSSKLKPTEKGHKEWTIHVYDGEGYDGEGYDGEVFDTLYSEEAKDAWIEKNGKDNWAIEVVIKKTEVTDVLKPGQWGGE